MAQRNRTVPYEGEIPQITPKGYQEIVNGSGDGQPATTMGAGGYLKVNYAPGARLQTRVPSFITEDQETSGGLTTKKASEFAQTTQGRAEFAYSREAMRMLMEQAGLPEGYNKATGMRAVRNAVGDVVSGAAESFYDVINNIRNGAYWHAIQEAGAEAHWSALIQAANAKDPELQNKMQNLVYVYDNGITQLAEMSQEDLAYLKIERIRNQDGSELSQEQKDLMMAYRELSNARVNDKVYQKFNQYFGQQMSDVFGFHTQTKGDYETLKYTLSKGAGDVIGSGLYYGYPGAALEWTSAIGRAGLAKYASKRASAQFVRRTAREMMKDYPWRAYREARMAAKQAFEFNAKWQVPMYTVMSGINGGKFVFSSSFFREYYDIRNEALAKGWDFNSANWLGTRAGFTEGALELVKFTKFTKRFLNSDPTLTNLIFQEVIPEALQEMSQTAAENFWTQTAGLTDKQWRDIGEEVLMAGAMGGLGGFGFGMIHYRNASMRSAEDAINKKYKEQADRAIQGKSDFLTSPYEDAVRNKKFDDTVQKLPYDSMYDGQGGWVMQPGQEGEIAPMEERRAPIIDNSRLLSSKWIEDKPQTKRNAEGQEVEDKMPNEAKRFITGDLIYTPTGEKFGVYGVILDENNNQIGTYERVTKRPARFIADPDIAQDLANADETVLNKQRSLYRQRAKSVNSKITEEQLERGWNMVRKAALHEQRTGDFSKAVSMSIDRMMDLVNTMDERFQNNLQILQQELGGDLSTEDIKRLQSDDAMIRYEAQWDLIEKSIARDFGANGMTVQGKLVAKNFRRLFEDMLLIDSNLDPFDFYNSVKPAILSFSRARINGQQVDGMFTMFDQIQDRSSELTADDAHSLAYRIIEAIETWKNGKPEDKDQAEAMIRQALFGQEIAELTIEDIEEALSSAADMEEMVSYDMGLDIGQDWDLGDNSRYKAMAIMRSMGFDQVAINDAFGVTGREDPNAEYLDALKNNAPALTDNELSTLQSLLNQAQQAEAESPELGTVHGAYDPNTRTIAVFNQRKGQHARPLTGVHEGMHWISDVLQSIAAQNEMIEMAQENLGSQYNQRYGNPWIGTLNQYTGVMEVRKDPNVPQPGAVFPTQTAFALTKAVRNAIKNRWPKGTRITSDMIEETFVNAMFDFLSDPKMVDPELRAAFTDTLNALNTHYQPEAETLYEKGSQNRQKRIKEVLSEMFKPGHALKMMKAANSLSKAISTANTKEELGQAILDAINQAGVIPGELTTAATVQDWMGRPEEEVSMLDMMDLAERVKDNIRTQAIRLAMLSEKKGNAPSSFDEIASMALPYKDIPTNTQTLFDRDGNPMQPKMARDGKTKERLWKETKDMFSVEKVTKAAKRFAESISHAARALKPELGSLIQTISYNHQIREFYAINLLGQINTLFNDHKKLAKEGKARAITEEQYKDFQYYLANAGMEADKKGDFLNKARNWMANHFNHTQAESEKAVKLFDDYIKAMDDAYQAMAERGVKLDKRSSYWPRVVDDLDGLLQALRHPEPGTVWDKRIRNMKEKGLTEEQIINELSKEFRRNPGENETEMFHKRVMKDVSWNMLQFYKDPFEAATDYLTSASRTIMMRELTGDIQYGEEGGLKKPKYGLTGTVSTMLYAIQKGELGQFDAKAFNNFVERMQQLQKRQKTTDEDIFDTFRALQGVFALGQFQSTINQFLELGPTMYRYGIPDVVDAICAIMEHKGSVDIAKIALRPLNEVQRLDVKGYMPAAQQKILSKTGFTKADVFMKNLVLQAALSRSQRILSNWDTKSEETKAWQRDFEATFPSTVYNEDKLTQIKQDLAKGNITKEVGLFLRNELAKTQPLDATEMPAGYAAAGSLGKLMYYLSTTSLKQAEFFLEDWKNAYKRGGRKELVKQLAKFAIYAAVIGIPVEVISALVAFKKPNVTQAALYSPGQYFFLNQYMVANARKDGLFSAAAKQMSWSLKVGDDVSKAVANADIEYLYPDIPGFGKGIHNLAGRGRKQLVKHKEAIDSPEPKDEAPEGKKDENYNNDKSWFGRFF